MTNITAKVGAYYKHQDGRTVGPVWEIQPGFSMGEVVVPSSNPDFITEVILEPMLIEEVTMNQNVKNFIKANDESPVVMGHVPYFHQEGGAAYQLLDGTRFRLTAEECRALPEGYPKWFTK